MNEATAVLIHLNDTPLFRMTLPSKLAGAFASGGLVLAGLQGEGAEVAINSGSAFVFHPEDAHALCKLIKDICNLSQYDYEQAVQRSIEFYNLNFNKEKLLKFYCELVESGYTKGIL